MRNQSNSYLKSVLGDGVVQRARKEQRVELFSGSKRRREFLRRVVTYFLLSALGLIMSLPFLWMLSTALKPDALVFSIPPEWFPRPWVWHNFIDSLTLLGHPVHLYVFNTTLIAVLGVLGVTLSSSLVAFGFARLDFPGRSTLFLLVLSTMMLPRIVTIVPQFILFQRIGWLDTFAPLIVPYWFGAPFHIFLLRQFFLSIPKELDDAARVDGASSLQIYWRIILPLAKPALATVAIFAFTYHWNDLLEPLIFLSSQQNWTLALFLASFQGYMQQPRWNLLMAASTILTLPVLILFFFAQRLFIGGITVTGIKG
ncbi:MAG: carbohydrate ABC transporter permease [Caldilinea sp.]|nr:carbohydrate ABC transporter permease [Caldilinea sp.]MDW8442380.1 carbohydrate ABC transporter permease [Caldilineaceae bacterium]